MADFAQHCARMFANHVENGVRLSMPPQQMSKLISAADKFRVSPGAAKIAWSLVPESDNLDWQSPGDLAWMEWPLHDGSGMVGALFLPNGQGKVLMECGPSHDRRLQVFSFYDYEGKFMANTSGGAKPKGSVELLEQEMAVLGVTLHLMANPLILQRVPETPTRQQLRAAQRSGRDLPAITDVIVHITQRERDEAAAAGTGPGKRLHHVEPFFRVKRGKVERVRGHWRGRPELGVVTHTNVTRVVP